MRSGARTYMDPEESGENTEAAQEKGEKVVNKTMSFEGVPLNRGRYGYLLLSMFILLKIVNDINLYFFLRFHCECW